MRRGRPPSGQGPADGTRRRFLLQAALLAAAPWVARAAPRTGGTMPALVFGRTEVDVRTKGARGDGRQDDTRAIQAAIDSLPADGGVVHIPAGTYLVDATRALHLRSHTRLVLADGAVLKAIPNDRTHYAILKIERARDVEVSGGRLVGERGDHRGSGGEWGHGLVVRGSDGVRIQDLHISDCWGDGVYIGAIGPRGRALLATNIELERVSCDNNRRQGLSITPCRNVRVVDCQFTNTHGTAPSSGIDIEPLGQGPAEGIQIERCTMSGNRGSGLELHADVRDLTVTGCTMADNRGYGVLGAGPADVTLRGNTITGNGLLGIIVRGRCRDIRIVDNTLGGNSERTLSRQKLKSLLEPGGAHDDDLQVAPAALRVTVTGNTFRS